MLSSESLVLTSAKCSVSVSLATSLPVSKFEDSNEHFLLRFVPFAMIVFSVYGMGVWVLMLHESEMKWPNCA